MFLFHHALVVDMLVDAPETLSIAPIVGVRESIFAKHITTNMMEKAANQQLMRNGMDGSKSFVAWACCGVTHEAVNHILRAACNDGHRDLVEWLIETGANDWSWGLWAACRGGHRELAELMIAKGTRWWNGGLWGACRGGFQELAELMIKRGAYACRTCGWHKTSGNAHLGSKLE